MADSIDIGSLELKVKTSTSEATKSINRLKKSLNSLKNSGGGKDYKRHGKDIADTNKKMASSFTKLAAKLGVFAIAAHKLNQKIGSWITQSNDYIENLNLFTASMGKYAEEAQNYAETVGEIMGIDPSDWMRNQGVFNTLAVGFGVASDRASLMSKNLTQLGYDLSSFFNISIEESMQKLQSGLAGELEPLRRIGFDLSKAKLEAIAADKGITMLYDDMDQAQKSQLRYYAMMTQVTVAHGDMARTLEAPANALRIFKAQLIQLSRAIGNIFIPLLNNVLPYMIAFTKAAREIAQAVAEFFGFALPEIDYSGIEQIAGDAEDTANNIDDATKAAGKFKRMLLGIDELNVLPDKNEGRGSGAGNGGIWKDFELPEYDFLADAMNERVDKIFAKLKPGIKWIQDHLKQIIVTVGLIGAGFLAWKFTKAFSRIFFKVVDILTNPRINWAHIGKGIGITMTLVGFTIETTGAISIGRDGANVRNVLQTAIGAALGIGGSLLLFGAGPVGWTVGIGLSVTAMIAGIKIGVDKKAEEEFWSSPQGEGLSKLKEDIENYAKINADLSVHIDSITGEVDDDTMANLNMAKDLIDEIFYIDSKDNKTAQEIAIIQEKIKILNGMDLGELSQMFQNTTDGYILPTAEAVQKVIDKLLKQYKIEALREAYVQSYKDQYEAQKNLLDITRRQEEEQEKYNNYLEYYNQAQQDQNDILAEMRELSKKGSLITDDELKRLEHLRELSEDQRINMDFWAKCIEETKPELDNLNSQVEAATENFDKATENVKYFGDAIDDAVRDGYGSGSKFGTDFISGFRKKWKNFKFDPKNVEVKPKNGSYTISAYASGGFPDEGQMFVAREAGPELVGSIRGRSAVVNNDQIVAAVSSGVYRAVINAMRESGGRSTVVAKVNNKVLLEAVVGEARNQAVMTGTNPLLEV